jgi:uncharacterized protein YyaL (SSP411 family)
VANRLAFESSPYLLQHAGNPVDWYPWGEEAFAKARAEGKPVFLSVGYSACHWCHVMERESFERPETAALLNRSFVSVKVDREERPDVDAVYMAAVQAVAGRGGWPMSVFLTPEGVPFFGGTYFPPRPLHGMPAFDEVLAAVAHAWQFRRGEVLSAGAGLVAALREASALPPPAEGGLDRSVLDRAVGRIASSFDGRGGGFGGAPKFPQPLVLDFLLRRAVATGDPLPLRMAERTLDAMAAGGIRDRIGGGFHRYSVDGEWIVPHFEKMLSDNALLARTYLRGWLVTGKGRWRRVAEETVDYLLREMALPEGGFCTSQDADSGGREGAFFTWSRKEVEEALFRARPAPFSREDVELFLSAHGVTEGGNFEGTNVLLDSRDAASLADERGTTEEDVEERLARMRAALFQAREERPRPGRDDKALAAWNGLALSALSEAARFLGREEYLRAAERCAAFLLEKAGGGAGRLFRSWKDGKARIPAFLEDYADVAEGLLDLYEAGFDERWFAAARGFCDAILARFADGEGGFLDAEGGHDPLVLPPRTVADGAMPSGGAAASAVLLRVEAATGDPRYGDAARSALARLRDSLPEVPLAFAQWLCALDLDLSPPVTVAVAGDDPEALLAVLSRAYRPGVTVACAPGRGETAVPILAGKAGRGGKATAFVCRRDGCLAPTDDPEELAAILDGARGGAPS